MLRSRSASIAGVARCPLRARTNDGSGAVDEVLAGRLGPEQREHDDLLVGVDGGVDDDRLSVVQAGQDLLDPIRAAGADVGQA